jgi:hypothetical protein
VRPSLLVQRASLMGSALWQQSAHRSRGLLPEELASERLDVGPVEELNDEGSARCVDQREGCVVGADGVYATDHPVLARDTEKQPSQQGQQEYHGATDCRV